MERKKVIEKPPVKKTDSDNYDFMKSLKEFNKKHEKMLKELSK